jgi:hypothetical protein
MPGAVVNVQVRVGDVVKANQACVVLNAMKMETMVAAPFDGKSRATTTLRSCRRAPGSMLAPNGQGWSASCTWRSATRWLGTISWLSLNPVPPKAPVFSIPPASGLLGPGPAPFPLPLPPPLSWALNDCGAGNTVDERLDS